MDLLTQNQDLSKNLEKLKKSFDIIKEQKACIQSFNSRLYDGMSISDWLQKFYKLNINFVDQQTAMLIRDMAKQQTIKGMNVKIFPVSNGGVDTQYQLFYELI